MKTIKKMMRHTVYEIIAVATLMVISLPFWDSFNMDEYTTLAAYYDNYQYIDLVVGNKDDYSLKYIDSVFCKPVFINAYNDSNTKENYKIWLVFDKQSIIDYNELVLKVGQEQYKLSDVETFEDEDNVYFLALSGSLVAGSTENVIYLGTTSKTSSLINQNIDFDIKNITRQA